MSIEFNRKRSIESGLVAKEEAAPDSRFVKVLDLEAGQWVKDHDAPITNVLPRPDGDYDVVLENADRIRVDRDDGLDILFNPPTDTTSGSDTRP